LLGLFDRFPSKYSADILNIKAVSPKKL